MKKARATRLMAMDLLPSEANEDIAFARKALAARRQTIVDIYASFAERLSRKGISAPSYSAFHRWASAEAGRRAATSRQDFKRELRLLLAEAMHAVADDLEASLEGEDEQSGLPYPSTSIFEPHLKAVESVLLVPAMGSSANDR